MVLAGLGFLVRSTGLVFLFQASAQVFDPRYLTSTLGGPTILMFGILATILGCDLRWRDRAAVVDEVLDSHPVKNRDLIIGRVFALALIVFALFCVAVAILLVAQRIAAFSGTNSGVSTIVGALTYALIDGLPLLFLWVALMAFLSCLFRNRFLVAGAGIAIVVGHYWIGSIVPLQYVGLVTAIGPLVPSLPSELLDPGSQNWSLYLHRLGIVGCGFGLVALSIAICTRRDQSSPPMSWMWVLAWFLAGSSCIGVLVFQEVAVQKQHQRWAEVHGRHASDAVLDLKSIEGSVRLFPSERLELDIVLQVTGRAGEPVEELLFGFNPGFSIESLKVAGDHPDEFEFADGLLRIPLETALRPDEVLSVELVASGLPNTKFGYFGGSAGSLARTEEVRVALGGTWTRRIHFRPVLRRANAD